MTDPALDSALTRWEEAHAAGQDLTAAELLPDRPELHAVVGQLLSRLRQAAERQRRQVSPWLVGFLATALLITAFLGLAGVWYYAALAHAEAEAAARARADVRTAEKLAQEHADLARANER